MHPLTVFGLLSAGSMLAFYSLERRANGFVLAFSFSCAASSCYLFLQGAWPFGGVEAVWAVVAFRRWLDGRP